LFAQRKMPDPGVQALPLGVVGHKQWGSAQFESCFSWQDFVMCLFW